MKKTSGSCWFYKTKVFPHWKKLWSLQKAHQQKKKNAELVGKATRGCLQDIFGTSKVERNWILQDHFFRTTQKQLPVPFPSMKSNTWQTEIKVVWRLLAKHVGKSGLKVLSTEVTFKHRLVWEELDHYWKKNSLSSLLEKKSFLNWNKNSRQALGTSIEKKR